MSLNTTWEYNGHSYELDLTDAETVERYENVFEDMQKKENEIPKTGKASERIRAYYGWFVELFDTLFGAGAGVEIIGEKANLAVCYAAYDSFLTFVASQADESGNFANSINQKYLNRAQRRASTKRKK